jgi:GNAT superfamily N-acetyltransferase
MLEIRELLATEGQKYLPDLASVLLDCVRAGASVSFMASLTSAEAEAFFEGVLQGVAEQERILLAAFVDEKLLGTVQVVLAMPPNQPHRAEIAKLLVAPSARRLGLASRLMERAEEAARAAGKTLLVLDTVTGGPAEQLYVRLGWTKTGVIPNYALFPDGTFCDTTIYWKALKQ